MSTHNIQFHDKMKISLIFFFFFLINQKNFVGTQNVFESSQVNQPSVFESWRFYCTFSRFSAKGDNFCL